MNTKLAAFLNKIVVIALFIFYTPSTQAQQISHYNQTLIAYNNNTRLSTHWGIWMDVQYKTRTDFFKDYDTKEKTIGLIYYPNEKIKITGAYTYVQSYPNLALADFAVPEYRPWQMLQWKSVAGPVKLSHWIRLEERFKQKTITSSSLSSDFDFSYRFRYNIFAQLPITHKKNEKGAFALVGANEIYLNYGENIVYNTFDQNRAFLGFFYYLNKHDFLQFGYTNAFQHLSSKDKYKSVDALKITFFNNLDLRKKKS